MIEASRFRRIFIDQKFSPFPEAESKEKHGLWDPMPELTITSRYVHSRVDSNTFFMGNPMPGSTLTLCQSRLYPPVRDLFSLCLIYTVTVLPVSSSMEILLIDSHSSFFYKTPFCASFCLIIACKFLSFVSRNRFSPLFLCLCSLVCG